MSNKSYSFFAFLFIALFLLTATLFSCSESDPDHPMQSVSWLLGTWENKTPRGSIYETWVQNGQDAYLGKTYTINGQDTMFLESVELRQIQDSLYYIPTVKNQNDGLPVTFTLHSRTDTSLIFANQEHDFPQVIQYRLIHQDSLDAFIGGMKDGEQRTILIPMRRLN